MCIDIYPSVHLCLGNMPCVSERLNVWVLLEWNFVGICPVEISQIWSKVMLLPGKFHSKTESPL